MPLQPGARLGAYEVLAPIGSGGMGEVYRARDSKLHRDVALKILPELFAHDLDRLARFQREAQVLASLNHPNIGGIHGLEEADGVRALVLELVEGPTLADRIAQGPIPIDDALLIARQIADALEAAHEHDIIHRDLKPANIKVTPEGKVKVLDFGLAKARAPESGSAANLTQSPTITSPAAMTGVGVLLGTAAYMSPEQAKGRAADKRSDVWSFGCVFYEMLTAKRAFAGDDVSDTLAFVITKEPDWSALPATTPVPIRKLLRRCLEKDRKRRIADIADARLEIDEALATPEAGSQAWTPALDVARRKISERIAWAAAAVAITIAALVASVAYFRGAPAEGPPVRFTIGPPEKELFDPSAAFLTVSPDGTKLAFIATGPSGSPQLWIRPLDSLAAQPLPGTDRAIQPFWSADSRFLAFYAGGNLKKIAVSGGPAQTLTAGFSGISAGAWSGEGVVLFTTLGLGTLPTIQRVSAAGGAVTPVTTLDASRQENAHLFPHFLPDGKHFLYFARSTKTENNAIYVGSLDSEERKLLLNANSNVAYSPPGYLLYNREGTLMAQPFDAERLQLTGDPVPVAEGVQFNPPSGGGGAAFTTSESGVLAYRAGGGGSFQHTLVWVSRNGAEQPLTAPPRAYDLPRLSPDGRRVVVEIAPQVWLYDVARNTLTRLTFEGTENQNPIWTPDGKRIVFASNKDGPVGNIFGQMADGSGGLERLTTGEYLQIPKSLSADGKLLAFHESNPTTQRDIWVLRLSDRKAQPFLRTKFNEGGEEFSPDGRWLAYVSNESGRPEIYVQPYPGPGGKWQVSVEGGTEPMWSRNGRELFYRSGTKMMAVETTMQPIFSAGTPRVLFEGQYLTSVFPIPGTAYDVSPDGQRFLMVKQGEQVPTQINVVQNWIEELKRLVPTR